MNCTLITIIFCISFVINLFFIGLVFFLYLDEEDNIIYKNTINDQSKEITTLKEIITLSNKERDYYKNRLDLILEAVRNGE